MRKIKSGKARFRRAGRAAHPRQGTATLQRAETPRWEDLALDSDLILFSSKHGIEPGAVIGQKDRWGVELHHLQRKETASECDLETPEVT